jgi:hypothetical protein
MFASWNAGTSSSVTLNGGWERISVTQIVPTSTKSLRVRLFGEAAAGTYYIAGVQLEQGSVATAFRRNANSVQGELAACQRYYYKAGPGQTKATYSIFNSGNFASGSFYFPVSLRTTPTSVTVYDNTGTINKISILPSGGSNQDGISLPSAVDYTVNSWAYNSGGVTGTPGTSGIISLLGYTVSVEL